MHAARRGKTVLLGNGIFVVITVDRPARYRSEDIESTTVREIPHSRRGLPEESLESFLNYRGEEKELVDEEEVCGRYGYYVLREYVYRLYKVRR